MLDDGEVATTTDSIELRLGDGVTAGGVKIGDNSSYVFRVGSTGTALENGFNIAAVLAAAKAMNPGGQPKSATNRVVVYLRAGNFDITGNAGPLLFDTPFVDLVGENRDSTRLIVNGDKNVVVSADNVWISNMTFDMRAAGVLPGNEYRGAIHFLPATYTTLGNRHTSLYIMAPTGTSYAITIAGDVTTWAGTFRFVTSAFSNLYSIDFGVSATQHTFGGNYENCKVSGGQSGTFSGGAFGGITNGASGNMAVATIFTGTIINCETSSSHIGIINRGHIRACRFRSSQATAPVLWAGMNGKFYYNWLIHTGTQYAIGYAEVANIAAAFNTMKAKGVDTVGGIVNLINTHYNVEDDDVPTS